MYVQYVKKKYFEITQGIELWELQWFIGITSKLEGITARKGITF